MAAVSIQLVKDDITPRLAGLADPELKSQALQVAGTVLLALGQRAFDEPGLRPQAWPARKSGGGHPLLLKSGTLRQSLFMRTEGQDSVRIGSPVVYAATHQMGRGAIPARPFLPITAEDQLTGEAESGIRDALEALIGG